ncbi:tectonin domain-containing protein, partial [Streptomyces mirabilis]|uniref:tectonin domain-containing protein n=1 Tax=Streptomyces mirabilis TaxID=68239 RepID=UPI00368D7718
MRSISIWGCLGVLVAPHVPGATCNVRRERGTTMADWKQVSGGLTTISVGSRTHVWGVNSLGQIYRY